MFGADKGMANRLDGKGLRIGIVQARFNQGITNALAKACWDELLARGVQEKNIDHVPGARRAGSAGGAAGDGGEGRLRRAGRAGLHHPRRDLPLRAGGQRVGRRRHARLALDYQLPIANAILTTENMEQADRPPDRQGPRRRGWSRSRWPTCWKMIG
jgi:6,7-dimethyl-8-ribityllumazine synthase